MLEIATTSACTGCHACYAVCPVSAINMKSDAEGFLYPRLDNLKCISCGKCESACPILYPIVPADGIPSAYACHNTNEEVRRQSSSGGVFTLLAERIIKEKGVVFGAKFAEEFSVMHSWTETIEGLADFRGSKYVQSVIGDSYAVCKGFLQKDICVLFSGTPCQIGGLKAFLRKEYDKLLCVDLICHGVPSPALWRRYIAERETQATSRVVKTVFRHKDCGWKRYSLSFSFENESEYLATLDKDPYMQMFLRDVCLRSSCYECSFKTLNRVSDITLADFWEIRNVVPEMDDDRGTSLVLVHSDAGKQMIAALQGVETRGVPAAEGIRYNPAMTRPAKHPIERDTFFVDLQKLNFQKLIQKYARDSISQRAYKLIRRILSKVKQIVLRKS